MKKTVIFIVIVLAIFSVSTAQPSQEECNYISSVSLISRYGVVESSRVLQLLDKDYLSYECVKHILGLGMYNFHMSFGFLNNTPVVLENIQASYGLVPGTSEVVYGLPYGTDSSFEKTQELSAEFTPHNIRIGDVFQDFEVCHLVKATAPNLYSSVSLCADFSKKTTDGRLNVSVYHAGNLRDTETSFTNCTEVVDENPGHILNLAIKEISSESLMLEITPTPPGILPPAQINVFGEVYALNILPDIPVITPDYLNAKNSMTFERIVLMDINGTVQFVRFTFGIWK